MTRVRPRLPSLALIVLAACASPAQPLESEEASAALNGQSSLLAGMHDIESSAFMRSWTTAADKGWLTDLRYIGSNGAPAIDCHATETAAGVAIIQRLDLDPSHSFPTGDPTGYANSFAAYVTACAQIHVWIVGNEPNVSVNNHDPANYAAAYAAAYVAVRARVHAIAGHQSDLVLVAPASPFSPFCICSMHKIIQQIVARGAQPDGFAVHAYTRADTPAQFGSLVGMVTSDAMNGSVDGCGYAFHSHFRIYRDWITALEAEGQGGKPVFLTEVGNACMNQSGNKCYPDTNIGYFQAMYGEIRAWNTNHNTKLKALTPYRWTSNDHGSGRDFAIGAAARTGLRADLTAAFAASPPPSGTCDNNVPLNGTACNPGDPGAQFVCTSPGAPSSQQWTRQACTSGQTCSGNHCQPVVPPATCDNNVPLNGTACNPGDPFAQFLCTNPGAPSSQQWTRQACLAGQSCSGTHCSGGPPACGTGLFCAGGPISGASPCIANSQTIYCCAPGHTIVNGACN